MCGRGRRHAQQRLSQPQFRAKDKKHEEQNLTGIESFRCPGSSNRRALRALAYIDFCRLALISWQRLVAPWSSSVAADSLVRVNCSSSRIAGSTLI